MIKYYFKLAFRQIWGNKTFSAINIIGLSAGLAVCFSILLFVNYQLSYDKYNEKLDRIFHITFSLSGDYYKMANPQWDVAGPIKNKLPEVKEAARFRKFPGQLMYKNEKIEMKRCMAADFSLFNILTLPILESGVTKLENINDGIILSESTAKKYFPNGHPLGEIITYTFMNRSFPLKVTAVMKDIPSASSFAADAVVSFNALEDLIKLQTENDTEEEKRIARWGNIYVLLNEKSDLNNFSKRLSDFSQRNRALFEGVTLEAFPLKDIYFHFNGYLRENSVYSFYPSGSMNDIYVYSAAAFVILLMAAINYMLMGIGKGLARFKEISVRKVSGAGKWDLFKQTSVEAVTISLIALPISILLLEVFFPYISVLLGREVEKAYFHNPVFLLFSGIITIIVGLLSGVYISFYLSRLNPIEAIKNKYIKGKGKALIRRIMVVTQLIISISLIFVIIAVSRQMSYFSTGIKGFNKSNLLIISPNSKNIKPNPEAFKTELKKNPHIREISSVFMPPCSGRAFLWRILTLDGSDNNFWADGLTVDHDFIETMGMKMKSGSSFKNFDPGNRDDLCIVNEAALKKLGIKNPIGEKIYKWEIIGVVEDFHNGSFKSKIGPVVIRTQKDMLSQFMVRIDENNVAGTLKYIQSTAEKFNNSGPIKYEYFDDLLFRLYGGEDKFSDIMKYSAVIALIIAMLGLFGMSVFAIQNRVKEVGIRKVVGASVAEIYLLLSKEFILLSLISSIIALPIGYYLITLWLGNYAYRINITADIFITSALIGFIVTLITISYKAISISRINPAENLRNE